jgi:hypothetical protein
MRGGAERRVGPGAPIGRRTASLLTPPSLNSTLTGAALLLHCGQPKRRACASYAPRSHVWARQELIRTRSRNRPRPVGEGTRGATRSLGWGAPFWAPTWAPSWAPTWAPVRTGAPKRPHHRMNRGIRHAPPLATSRGKSMIRSSRPLARRRGLGRARLAADRPSPDATTRRAWRRRRLRRLNVGLRPPRPAGNRGVPFWSCFAHWSRGAIGARKHEGQPHRRRAAGAIPSGSRLDEAWTGRSHGRPAEAASRRRR